MKRGRCKRFHSRPRVLRNPCCGRERRRNVDRAQRRGECFVEHPTGSVAFGRRRISSVPCRTVIGVKGVDRTLAFIGGIIRFGGLFDINFGGVFAFVRVVLCVFGRGFFGVDLIGFVLFVPPT